eukprot:m.289600 g.289600  ORF g.289600 m.289600 type:complete len:125 (+) comp27110_c0_seq4:254-628(+)
MGRLPTRPRTTRRCLKNYTNCHGRIEHPIGMRCAHHPTSARPLRFSRLAVHVIKRAETPHLPVCAADLAQQRPLAVRESDGRRQEVDVYPKIAFPERDDAIRVLQANDTMAYIRGKAFAAIFSI